MADSRPCFLITIDTEGDNLWSRPRTITTENSRHLPRFQALCERFGLKPTYLVNYEMACCPVFQEFGRYLLSRGSGEIGMHLRAWNSPPIVPLTSDDYRHQPFLIEYPEPVMRDKVHRLTDLLEDTFDCPMVSHRAGRWAIDERYARHLVARGYLVDCSITPHVTWSHMLGDPNGCGGCDYRESLDDAYFIDLNDVTREGDSAILEVPMTVRRLHRGRAINRLSGALRGTGSRMLARVVDYVIPRVAWLRPNGRNLKSMLSIVRQAANGGRRYVQFMVHSSEFMPGGSPYFRSKRAVERLYDHLEQLFAAAGQLFRGATLAEYYLAARTIRRSPIQPGTARAGARLQSGSADCTISKPCHN